MQLKRIYPHWDAVKAAGGTPSSRKPHVWREVLRTRPAIAYWAMPGSAPRCTRTCTGTVLPANAMIRAAFPAGARAAVS